MSETGHLRVVVADDEPLARRRVRALLKKHKDVEVVAEASDGAEAVAAVRRHRPDILFLDVQMPELDGFGVLRALGPKAAPAVVFVTAFDRYALQAFEVNAVDYLLKPFDEERFGTALARARATVQRRQGGVGGAGALDQRLIALIEQMGSERSHLDRIMVKDAGRVFFIKTADIDWVEADGNYAKLHTAREAHLVRETMNELEAQLDPSVFVRIHRSTLVNIDRIKEMQPWFSGDYTVILTDGTQLRLSRSQREKLLDRLGRPA